MKNGLIEWRDTYLFTHDPVVVASGGQNSVDLTAPTFLEVNQIVGKIIRVAGSDVTLNVQQSRNQENWAKTQTYFDNFAGTAQLPMIFKYPRHVGKSETLTINFTEYTGAGQATVQIVFVCAKVLQITDDMYQELMEGKA